LIKKIKIENVAKQAKVDTIAIRIILESKNINTIQSLNVQVYIKFNINKITNLCVNLILINSN